MHLIVGLGNPGPEYRNNRHNVGFICLDAVIEQFGVSSLNWKNDHKMQAELVHLEDKYLFAKPQTFMNRSGDSVAALMQQYKLKLEHITVIHDDLDLPLGSYKFSSGTGPKQHNGLSSIEGRVGSSFDRFRIGIESRSPEQHIPGKAFVLQDFTAQEQEVLPEVFEDIYDHLMVQMIARQKPSST